MINVLVTGEHPIYRATNGQMIPTTTQRIGRGDQVDSGRCFAVGGAWECSGEVANNFPEDNLFSEIQISEHSAVALNVALAQVVEQPFALADQAQQPQPGGVVFLVLLEVLG